MESLIFNAPPRGISSLIARLTLRVVANGEMPELAKFVLTRGNSQSARIVKTKNSDFIRIVGDEIEEFPFMIDDTVDGLLANLGVTPVRGTTPREYQSWISQTLTLPGRKVVPDKAEDLLYPPIPVANDWETILSKRLDCQSDFSDIIRATFWTQIKDEDIAESQQLGWQSFGINSAGMPIRHTEAVVFPYNHGELAGIYGQTTDQIIEERRLNHPGNKKHQTLVGKDAVNLAERVLNALDRDRQTES